MPWLEDLSGLWERITTTEPGHGVGYLLNVHEGPQSFRWKSPAELPAPVLEEGMITSDEPGYYAENEFGIRHENLVVCKKAEKTSYGQFMKFEPLTLVPFDLEGIDPEQMEAGEQQIAQSVSCPCIRKDFSVSE